MEAQELQKIKNKYDIIGNDPALNRAIEMAMAVALTELTVLVTGESGVGKDNMTTSRKSYTRTDAGRMRNTLRSTAGPFLKVPSTPNFSAT